MIMGIKNFEGPYKINRRKGPEDENANLFWRNNPFFVFLFYWIIYTVKYGESIGRFFKNKS